MRTSGRAATVLATLAVAALVAPAAAVAGPSRATEAESDCFWLGPISYEKRATNPERFDGQFFNFPEESATYWVARYRLAAGQRLELHGRYPHARYESLNSYQEGGTPVSSLADVSIAPDRGSTNPFVRGARRDLRKRDWTVSVLDAPPPTTGVPRANTLYTPSSATVASEMALRVYEPDRGRDLTGGVGLPRPEIVNADGSRVRGLSNVCGAINDPDRSLRRTVQSIPASVWDSLVNTPGPDADPRTSPAFDPPQWERFFSQLFSAGVFQQAAGNPRPTAGMEELGGFYSNRDTRYVLTHLSRRFGEVLVIRGKMPTYPRTYDGARRMPRGQVRFWSLCSNEGRVTTYAPDCLADRQVPLTRNRRFTIVVSKTADRPRNARRRCGVGWLQWPRNGEYPGGRRDYGLLILRNMLSSPGFAQHDRMMRAISERRRGVPLVVGGDMHATAAGTIQRSGRLDLRRNPVHVALSGTLGSRGAGFPRPARHTPAAGDPPRSRGADPAAGGNGFLLADVTQERVVLRFFRWNSTTQSEDQIDRLGPFRALELAGA